LGRGADPGHCGGRVNLCPSSILEVRGPLSPVGPVRPASPVGTKEGQPAFPNWTDSTAWTILSWKPGRHPGLGESTLGACASSGSLLWWPSSSLRWAPPSSWSWAVPAAPTEPRCRPASAPQSPWGTTGHQFQGAAAAPWLPTESESPSPYRTLRAKPQCRCAPSLCDRATPSWDRSRSTVSRRSQRGRLLLPRSPCPFHPGPRQTP